MANQSKSVGIFSYQSLVHAIAGAAVSKQFAVKFMTENISIEDFRFIWRMQGSVVAMSTFYPLDIVRHRLQGMFFCRKSSSINLKPMQMHSHIKQAMSELVPYFHLQWKIQSVARQSARWQYYSN